MKREQQVPAVKASIPAVFPTQRRADQGPGGSPGAIQGRPWLTADLCPQRPALRSSRLPIIPLWFPTSPVLNPITVTLLTFFSSSLLCFGGGGGERSGAEPTCLH